MQAFYLPNVEAQQKCYQENCELLGGYPYLFCKDFLPFDSLPILFFPFNDKGYIPFFKTQNRFGEYIDFNDPVIDRNFFHDLENPILAEDVFSQYQLEYLNDNVRKSEWVARENHIYLHYTDWNTFCAYLSCLQFSRLLPQQKFVFLVEKEIAQYPIDLLNDLALITAGTGSGRFPIKRLRASSGIRSWPRIMGGISLMKSFITIRICSPWSP